MGIPLVGWAVNFDVILGGYACTLGELLIPQWVLSGLLDLKISRIPSEF